LSLYGFQDLLAGPAGALFEASIWMDRHRLPELFCGFHRREGEGPTRYPVACSPQAWSSGVVFQLLQASLRLGIDPDRPRLSIHATALPPFLTWIRVHNLALPFGEADLLFEQHQRDIGVTVLRKQGSFEICVLK
jgi:glycogen debranching enzyme